MVTEIWTGTSGKRLVVGDDQEVVQVAFAIYGDKTNVTRKRAGRCFPRCLRQQGITDKGGEGGAAPTISSTFSNGSFGNTLTSHRLEPSSILHAGQERRIKLLIALKHEKMQTHEHANECMPKRWE